MEAATSLVNGLTHLSLQEENASFLVDLGLQKVGRPGFEKSPWIRSEKISQFPLLTSHPHLSQVFGWLGPTCSSQQVLPNALIPWTKPVP